MSLSTQQSQPAYTYYEALLYRYARCIIKDTHAAARLVKQVLQEHAESGPLQLCGQQRRLLKETTRLRCFCWQQAQVFDRPVVKTAAPGTHQNNNPK